MVGDQTDGYVVIRIGFISLSGKLADTVADRAHRVDIERVRGVITEDTEVTVTYYPMELLLTIHYRYTTGGTAAPDYTAPGHTGGRYHVVSPVIPGYTVDQPVVEGVMPGHNVEITVWYAPIYVPPVDPVTPTPAPETIVVSMLTIDEYGAALGLGDVSVNVGDTIE